MQTGGTRKTWKCCVPWRADPGALEWHFLRIDLELFAMVARTGRRLGVVINPAASSNRYNHSDGAFYWGPSEVDRHPAETTAAECRPAVSLSIRSEMRNPAPATRIMAAPEVKLNRYAR